MYFRLIGILGSRVKWQITFLQVSDKILGGKFLSGNLLCEFQSVGSSPLGMNLFPQPFEQATEARQKIADYYKKLGNKKKRKSWLKEIVAANKASKSTERTQFLAAKASLELAEPAFRSYRGIHLVQPLKKNLKKKKNAMKKVIDAYTEAANYGVAEVTTASTYRIAEVYSDFSRGLFSSERPKGLSSAELEQYDLLLEEQAFPFEEKAIEIHESNAGRVRAGVYDEWVKKSLLALRKLQPVRYAKLERSELFDVVME